MKYIGSAFVVLCAFLALGEIADASEATVPEPFQGFDDNSKYAFNYDDLSTLLGMVVADVGRSDRSKAPPTQAQTGTRAQAKINRATVNEGNRFFFETFENDDAAKQMLGKVQQGLEQASAQVHLAKFSRNEQLAYWLNLYNATVLNEIVKVYPQRNLEKLLYGDDSIMAKKLLMVEGVPLSLDDIQFRILKQNYDNNPLVIYGLYQGIIGGPNIRQKAYTGADVYQSLKENAIEFVNSNRGTAIRNKKSFKVSSFYARNQAYFPDFDADLTAHISQYLEGPELAALRTATRIEANINDWTVTDLGGTRRVIGGSLANSSAALMGSVNSSAPASVGSATAGIANSGAGSSVNSAVIRQVQENKEHTADESAGSAEDSDTDTP